MARQLLLSLAGKVLRKREEQLRRRLQDLQATRGDASGSQQAGGAGLGEQPEWFVLLKDNVRALFRQRCKHAWMRSLWR